MNFEQYPQQRRYKKLSNLHCHSERIPLLYKPDNIPNSETKMVYKVQVDHKVCANRAVYHMSSSNPPSNQHDFRWRMLRNPTP